MCFRVSSTDLCPQADVAGQFVVGSKASLGGEEEGMGAGGGGKRRVLEGRQEPGQGLMWPQLVIKAPAEEEGPKASSTGKPSLAAGAEAVW